MALIDTYVLELKRRGLAEGTIEKRQRCVELLARKYDLATVSSEEIQAYLDTRDLNSRTRYCWLSHLSMFFAWAVTNEWLLRNPVAKLQRPKLRRLVPDPTPDHEVMAAMQAGTPLLRCWVTLMAFGGLRCGEVAGLRCEDVDLEAGADIADVAELLGHSSLATTQGYAQASLRRMRRAMSLIS